MNTVIRYIRLLVLKNPFHELTVTKSFFLKCLAFYLFSGTVFATVLSGDIVSSFLEISLNAIIMIIILSGLIVANKDWTSFNTLLASVIVCENFFLALDIGSEGLEYFLETTPYRHVVAVLGAVLFIWNFLVIAKILKNTFNFSLLTAFVISVLYFSATDGIPLMLLS